MSPRTVTMLPDCLLLGGVLLIGLLHWLLPVATVATVWSRVISIVIGVGAISYGLGVLRRLSSTDAGSTPTQLVITGIFARSRNPYYLLCVVFLSGLAGVSGAISTAIVPLLYFLAIHPVVFYEEHLLQEQFGAAYSRYRTKVRRWL